MSHELEALQVPDESLFDGQSAPRSETRSGSPPLGIGGRKHAGQVSLRVESGIDAFPDALSVDIIDDPEPNQYSDGQQQPGLIDGSCSVS